MFKNERLRYVMPLPGRTSSERCGDIRRTLKRRITGCQHLTGKKWRNLWLYPALGALVFAGLVVLLLVLPKRPAPPVPFVPRPFDTLHPHTQAAFRRLGIAPERVTQGLGFAPSSAGIHGTDGTIKGRPYCAAFDLSVSDLTPAQTQTLLRRLRGAGFVCWWRIPGVSFPVTTALGIETGPHIHGVDPFVPHKRRLEMQIRDYAAGNNGIEVGRYAHWPDPPAADPQTAAERRLLYRIGEGWHLRTD